VLDTVEVSVFSGGCSLFSFTPDMEYAFFSESPVFTDVSRAKFFWPFCRIAGNPCYCWYSSAFAEIRRFLCFTGSDSAPGEIILPQIETFFSPFIPYIYRGRFREKVNFFCGACRALRISPYCCGVKQTHPTGWQSDTNTDRANSEAGRS
jgi:hypothetical protein